nr:MAG TPA: hypothetical protein [Caudoviricetes sp.]
MIISRITKSNHSNIILYHSNISSYKPTKSNIL